MTPPARTTDPDTSHDAAVTAESNRQWTCLAVMDALRELDQATDEEIEEWTNDLGPTGAFSPSGLRTRRKEMVRAGIVRKAEIFTKFTTAYELVPLRRRNRSGCEAQVWELTPREEGQ